jgi:hypothetical protein
MAGQTRQLGAAAPAWEHDSMGPVQGLSGAAELGRAKAVSLTAAALVRAAARPRLLEVAGGKLGASDTLADGVWMAMASPQERGCMDKGCCGVVVRERNVLTSTKGKASAPVHYTQQAHVLTPSAHGEDAGTGPQKNSPGQCAPLGSTRACSNIVLSVPLALHPSESAECVQEAPKIAVSCTAQPDKSKLEQVAGFQHSRWLDPSTGLPYTRVNHFPSWLDNNGARRAATQFSSWLDPSNGVRRSGNDQV